MVAVTQTSSGHRMSSHTTHHTTPRGLRAHAELPAVMGEEREIFQPLTLLSGHPFPFPLCSFPSMSHSFRSKQRAESRNKKGAIFISKQSSSVVAFSVGRGGPLSSELRGSQTTVQARALRGEQQPYRRQGFPLPHPGLQARPENSPDLRRD